jgi:hypothetical protein
MNPTYPLHERKLVYRLLHRQLSNFPQLMEGDFLLDLQRDLQKIAQEDGVDIGDHGDWDAWLGNQPVACDVRLANRKVLS